jgi:hypothetical protein
MAFWMYCSQITIYSVLLNLNSWSLSQLLISFMCTELLMSHQAVSNNTFRSCHSLCLCLKLYELIYKCFQFKCLWSRDLNPALNFILCALPLLEDSMHLFSFDFMLRSQYDLEVGQSEARNWVSHLEHQRWLATHYFILRALIGSSFRDQLPTCLLQWRSVVRNDILQNVTVFT